MKKLLFPVSVLVCFIISSCNDKKISASDVPKPAVSAFNAKYPEAKDVSWITEKKDNKTLYEAQFKLNDKKVEAEFDADGNFVAQD